MAALEIQNVRKTYGGKTEVLKGINISIEKGEFLILVGPSGCGKSTLMNSIAGLEEITDGAILIGGEDVSGRSPKDRDIAMVFQSYALYPSMNVRDNIAFGLEMRKVPKDERTAEVERVAKMLQIEHLLDRKPSQLSGGQRQRVAMGRALARKPKIYLFDEPLSNLDAKLRVEMRTEIKKLHQNLGTTIVYVTHDQIEAMTLADRIAVMKDGIVQQFGTPQEIYDEPANIFVAGFMGSPAMNFIPVQIQNEGGGLVAKVTTRDGRTYSLPLGERGACLANYVGKQVTLGLRPERVTQVNPHEVERADVMVLEAEIDMVEPTGPDTVMHIHLNGTEVSCRVAPDSAGKLGEKMNLMLDLSKAVFFDIESQARIG
ncbi:sn-glycerol-3-phosphate ABC transporter ATP-binding protein UgpC [Hahella aquimaris]|uniref:ABC transporter ATP-binding protein n=1 Tax=Hahella sp. HNIBRBA332 TaxID=3015983 RepID=UPI00273C2FB9|nr:sn-glycerol-3-phosphate ABC transporter ATP-binding protein UgpC [Hahella sp. HNIBRBA332]WLQ13919.1 sn-glycerol-3-phosphate ABC transporter ATP-binding protein UgpC [Hahella sp. HNIBRBA332]